MNVQALSRSRIETEPKRMFRLITRFYGSSVFVSVVNQIGSDTSLLASMVIKVSDPTIMPLYSDIQRVALELFSTEEGVDVDRA